MVPWLLRRLGGNQGAVHHGSVKSLLAFWLGGAAGPSTATRRRVGRVRRTTKDEWDKYEREKPRGFSRAYFEELKAATAALIAAERKAERVKEAERRRALQDAADAAAEALETAEQELKDEAELRQLTLALNAAVRAKTFQGQLRQAQTAIAIAEGIKRSIEDEDEEEAIMLLLH